MVLCFKYSGEFAGNGARWGPCSSDICHARLLTKDTAGEGVEGRCWLGQEVL